MKYIKDLFEDGEESPNKNASGENPKKSYWIIYKSNDESRAKVDSFEGDDEEIEEYLSKKNSGEEKYKAWTIDGIEVGDDEDKTETEEE